LSRTGRLTRIILCLGAGAAACADSAEAPERSAPLPAATADNTASTTPSSIQQIGGAPVEVTAEDSAIFRRTIEWATRERVDTLPPGEIMARAGRRFVGEPYVPRTLDPPGPERLIVNLRTFDCVTYVESMLALARVIRAGESDFATFVRELRRIRYRDAIGATYPDRLHYFSEWIAANDARGLVDDITPELGARLDSSRVDFMSTHVDAYWQLADSTFLRAIRDTEVRLSAQPRPWIPETRIAAVADRIRNGDVIAATSTVPGLDIAHTGLALWIDGRLHLMHAPLVGSIVEISEVPLAERIVRIEGQDGIMVARPL
jgi:hypothetical protein